MLRDLATGDERLLLPKIQRDDQESRPNRDLVPTYSFTPDSKSIVIGHHGHFWRADVADGKGDDDSVHRRRRHDDRRAAARDVRVNDSTLIVHQIRDVAPSPDNKRIAFVALDRCG